MIFPNRRRSDRVDALVSIVLFVLGFLTVVALMLVTAIIIVLPAWTAARGIAVVYHSLARDYVRARRAVMIYALLLAVTIGVGVTYVATGDAPLRVHPLFVLVLDTLLAIVAAAAWYRSGREARGRCTDVVAAVGLVLLVGGIALIFAAVAVPFWVLALSLHAGLTLALTSRALRRLEEGDE